MYLIIGGSSRATLVVAGTYEWYFVILFYSVRGGGDTQILPAVIEFV